jgi:hypothetical protein
VKKAASGEKAAAAKRPKGQPGSASAARGGGRRLLRDERGRPGLSGDPTPRSNANSQRPIATRRNWALGIGSWELTTSVPTGRTV